MIFLLIFIFNAIHAHKQMRTRYYGWWTEHPEYKDYDTISPYLRTLGIQPMDTVICLPDMSHFTLYLMNQRGWTECMGANRDSAGIATSIHHGAKYLIVNGNEIISRNYIQSFLSKPFGQYGNIRIFKLDKENTNDSIKEAKTPVLVEKLTCSAEKVSDDKKFFIADSSDFKLEGACARSSENALSGKFSAKLTPDCAFGMIYRCNNVKPREHFLVSVYRHTEEGKGALVVSAKNSGEFYISRTNATEKLSNGWEKLNLNFFINFTPTDGEIDIYLWNSGSTPVFFDDLSIIRTRYTYKKH